MIFLYNYSAFISELSLLCIVQDTVIRVNIFLRTSSSQDTRESSRDRKRTSESLVCRSGFLGNFLQIDTYGDLDPKLPKRRRRGISPMYKLEPRRSVTYASPDARAWACSQRVYICNTHAFYIGRVSSSPALGGAERYYAFWTHTSITFPSTIARSSLWSWTSPSERYARDRYLQVESYGNWSSTRASIIRGFQARTLCYFETISSAYEELRVFQEEKERLRWSYFSFLRETQRKREIFLLRYVADAQNNFHVYLQQFAQDSYFQHQVEWVKKFSINIYLLNISFAVDHRRLLYV